jgi:hypothetical protein
MEFTYDKIFVLGLMMIIYAILVIASNAGDQ